MPDDQLGELRAAVDGLEVVVRFRDDEAVTPALRAALAELADAMHAEQLAAAGDHAEVAGFGLQVGALGLESRNLERGSTGVWDSCWGYQVGGHCSWYSGRTSDTGGPTSCTIHSISK